jgi:hypothetical protein
MDRQSSAPGLSRIVFLGLLAAALFGAARYLREGIPTHLASAFATFLATVGWLFLAGALALIVVWTARVIKS